MPIRIKAGDTVRYHGTNNIYLVISVEWNDVLRRYICFVKDEKYGTYYEFPSEDLIV